MDLRTGTTRAAIAAGAVVLVVAIALVAWWAGPEPDRPEPQAAPSSAEPPASTGAAPAAAVDPVCGDPARQPFVPERITVEGVIDDAEVRALPRDGRGVTGVPPLGSKDVFAWDLGGIRPGSLRGNVLLNTHTWADGSAAGNALLDGMHKGDRIVLRGDGSTLCYLVTRRIEVLAADGYPPYYDEDGPPRIAMIVCSGERIGPGRWTHRTIWFATPIG